MLTTVVTGASRGIGMATALVLARAGHRVIGAMRNPERSPELQAAAEREGLRVEVERLDVDDGESVRACFARIGERGPVDVLVNNAGVERTGSMEETPLEAFRTCMETNFFGAVRCFQAVAGQMRERGRGWVVNVTSVSGKISGSPMGPYAASKFALEAASEAMAQEMKPFGVRVAIVQPGIIDTRMARNVEGIEAKPSFYPHARRMAALFGEALQTGDRSADQVGQKILEILESGTWALRHPVGPDAAPFLGWRASLSDEAWTDFHAQSDEEWLASVRQYFGMDLSGRLKQ